MAYDPDDDRWQQLLRPLGVEQRAWVLGHPVWAAAAGGVSGAHCLVEIGAWRSGVGERPSSAVFEVVAAAERVWAQ